MPPRGSSLSMALNLPSAVLVECTIAFHATRFDKTFALAPAPASASVPAPDIALAPAPAPAPTPAPASCPFWSSV